MYRRFLFTSWLLQHSWLSFSENCYSFCFAILFQELLHFSCPLQAKNSRFEFFVYELTVGDRFGSSRAYEPSSFLRIRYTINMTTKMAHRRPTTAPPITAAIFYKRISTTIQFIWYTTKLHNMRFLTLNSPTPKCMHACTDRRVGRWMDRQTTPGLETWTQSFSFFIHSGKAILQQKY